MQRPRLSMCVMVATVVTCITPALADSCDPARIGAQNAMGQKIDGKLDELQATIVALSSQNTEVAKQVIDSLQQSISTISNNKKNASDGAGEEAFLQCKQKQAPIQSAIDIGVITATSALVVLLPPKAWHIDAGDILGGNVLGGKCSFVRNPLGHGC